MDVTLFDYELPEERIALRPVSPRNSARMLAVKEDGTFAHATVDDLPVFLRGGDLLVVNDSKVIPARLHARKPDGRAVELLLYRRTAPDRFLALARPARKLHPNDLLYVSKNLAMRVCARHEGEVEVAFAMSGAALDAVIAEAGEMPLPPYIARRRAADAQDVVDYQTIFAAHQGSSAAPTAGLHFTPDLLARLAKAGVQHETVTLHVGPGTFLPVNGSDTAAHRMHSERLRVEAQAAERINAARRAGGRIVAVGTTSLRALETATDAAGAVGAYDGETELFVMPGYCFKSVDVLLTNFHLPRSTLFMLVAAFVGLDTVKRAYAAAIAENYRFYSYGDASLLFRPRA